jgi:hypothetical protein
LAFRLVLSSGLGWTLIVSVMAFAMAVRTYEETLECRQAAVGAGLSLKKVCGECGADAGSREELLLSFFLGLLGICFFSKLTGMLAWIDSGSSFITFGMPTKKRRFRLPAKRFCFWLPTQ